MADDIQGEVTQEQSEDTPTVEGLTQQMAQLQADLESERKVSTRNANRAHTAEQRLQEQQASDNRIGRLESSLKLIAKDLGVEMPAEEPQGQPAQQSQRDPMVDTFLWYAQSHGLGEEDPLMKEALTKGSPTEALEFLRGKLDEKGKAEADAAVEQKVQKLLKDKGLTGVASGGPSASGVADWGKLSPRQKIDHGIKERNETQKRK